MVCGIDRQAGGTWLGVNQFGLLVPVTNRPKVLAPLEPRSRGLLCRDLLDRRNARDAVDSAVKELSAGGYAGANYLCADDKYAAVVYGGNRVEVAELTPGLHTLTNGDLDDPNDERHQFLRRMLTLHTLDSAVTFLAVASRACSRKPNEEGRRGVVLTGGDYGTVSSTLLGAVAEDPALDLSVQSRPAVRDRPTTTFPRCCARSFPPAAAGSRPSTTAKSRRLPRARSRAKAPVLRRRVPYGAPAAKSPLRDTRRADRSIGPAPRACRRRNRSGWPRFGSPLHRLFRPAQQALDAFTGQDRGDAGGPPRRPGFPG